MPLALPSITDVAENFWGDVDFVRRAQSRAELEQATTQFSAHLGFGQHGYATRFRTSGADGYEYFHNFDSPYGNYRYEYVYRREPEKDPVLMHLQGGLPAAAFSKRDGMDIGDARGSTYEQILSVAAEHGIRAGIGVPLTSENLRWGFMLLTTDATDRVADVRPYLPHLCLFAHFIFLKMRNLHGTDPGVPNLSDRELEVLRWATVGKTSWEIGQILKISESTVNFHLGNAAKRLHTHGRRATCARGVALGLISG